MTAKRNLVLASLEAEGGGRCIDVFRRPDGTFGFEEYRRDGEDGRGWYRVGGYGEQIFASEADARAAAGQVIPWLPKS